MKIIYVSGRYRARSMFGKLINILKARRVAQELWKRGWVVICHHMNTALFIQDSINYIDGDCEIVRRCDAIYMLKGWMKSEGARKELATAMSKGVTIYYE